MAALFTVPRGLQDTLEMLNEAEHPTRPTVDFRFDGTVHQGACRPYRIVWLEGLMGTALEGADPTELEQGIAMMRDRLIQVARLTSQLDLNAGYLEAVAALDEMAEGLAEGDGDRLQAGFCGLESAERMIQRMVMS
ncbi:MAG: hypothetical protein ACYCW6_22745 [Candidatus Xenobia bacterium]